MMGIGQGPVAPRPQRTRGQEYADMLGAASIPMSAIPIAGDITGLAADAAMYSAYPEERTMGNYAMSALGVLPLVPGAAALRAARGAASPLEGVVDAPQETVMQRPANPDDYEITFHRSNEPSAFTVLPRYRQGGAEFDGVFAGPRAGMYGDFTHAFVVPKAKILRHYDLKYDVPYEDYQKAVRAVHPEWDDEQIERAFDYVTEDKNIIDQDPEDYADLFKGDSATASNLAQGLRGAVARNLGYDAVEMLDETGTSLQILSGARSMPLPKDMTFDDATREIYESLKNPKNLSTPSPSPLEGAMDMSTDARMQRAAEQGYTPDLYHGTAADVSEFNPLQFGGSATKARSAKLGTWLVDNPEVAGGYARFAAEDVPVQRLLDQSMRAERLGNFDEAARLNELAENLDLSGELRGGGGQNVMPLRARGNFLERDAEGATMSDLDDRQLTDWAKEAKAKGFDGLKINNFSDNADYGQYMPATHYLIFNPSNIRSVNAAFDPTKRGSANLGYAKGGAVTKNNIERATHDNRRYLG
jgi:hypothetical protein